MLSSTNEQRSAYAQKKAQMFITTIPTDIPKFTTPSLDFTLHSKQLKELVDRLYAFRDGYLQDRNENDEDNAIHDKDWAVEVCVEHVLKRFNALTTPPPLKKPLNGKTRTGSSHPPTMAIPKEILAGTTSGTSNVPLYKTSIHTFDATLTTLQKSFYYFLRGHLYNIFPHYHPFAETNLAKAIKLNPKNIEAWNSLGSCYWKKCDFVASKQCFESALDEKRNSKSLIMFAMVLRQMEISKETLNQSIELCKEALSLNFNDRDAWYGIGMSHLRLFFDITRDVQDLKKSLAAFNRSEMDSVDPDLFYNRAIIRQYMELFNDAIKDYEKSSVLDPLLAQSCKSQIHNINLFLRKYSHAVISKAGLKQGVLNGIIERLKPNGTSKMNGFDKLDRVASIKDLSIGKNPGKLIQCQLVSYIDDSTSQFLIGKFYVGVDGSGDAFGVSIYNLAPDRLKRMDVLEIAEPDVLEIVVDCDGNESGSKTSFLSIRVHEPPLININGILMDASSVAWASIRVESK